MEEQTSIVDKPLKDLIQEAGHTQKSFAKALDLAYSTVHYYVVGQKCPSSLVLANMCRVLERPPKEVLASLGIDVSGIPDDKAESLKPSQEFTASKF
jgi:hypothetical protein